MSVDHAVVGEVAGGLCVLVGVTHDDTPERARQLAAKVWNLRIFDAVTPAPEPNGAAPGRGGERSLAERTAAGEPVGALVISQFTLYADTSRGRRPGYGAAAPGPVAEPLVAEVVAELTRLGAQVATGRFGADMAVTLTNDGPFTILLDVPAAGAS
ncbi:MAG: D-aminoacyl-tRNA deacylase [Microthrixaceae bacterium]